MRAEKQGTGRGVLSVLCAASCCQNSTQLDLLVLVFVWPRLGPDSARNGSESRFLHNLTIASIKKQQYNPLVTQDFIK